MDNKTIIELLRIPNKFPTHLGRVIARVEVRNAIRKDSLKRQMDSKTRDGKVKWIFSL